MVIGQNKQEGRDFGDKFVVGNWQLYAQSPSLKKSRTNARISHQWGVNFKETNAQVSP
jgi:hypothetical protein